MASYRPFPSQTTFGSGPPPPPPPPQHAAPPPPPSHGARYTQNWGFNSIDGPASSGPPPSSYPKNYNQMHQPSSNFQHSGYGPSTSFGPPPPPHHHQYSYPQPPPPPPDSSYQQPPPPPPPTSSVVPNSINLLQPPPPPAPSMYYPSSSQYARVNHQPLQPLLQPPPPSSPPSFPPMPSSPTQFPPPSRSLASAPDKKTHGRDKFSLPKGSLNHSLPPPRQQKHHPHQTAAAQKPSGPSGRVETEEERRLRKKREFEKQRQEEKYRQQLKESQATVLRKTQLMSTGMKGHGSIAGSGLGERKATPFLSGDRIENRLKKPTTFMCKMKFWNELPDPTAQPKLMALKADKDRFTRYSITSLEKAHKPQLHVEPDLGIPLDLLDISVYNPPSVRQPLDPEDEELLHDDESATPVKQNGIKRKERPTDQGVSWLVKTQYISPLSMEATKQSLTEKQAKELREAKDGKNILEDFNSRERKIHGIEASFEASKLPPVHSTNKKLQPVEILPLFPDFERFEDQFVVATFDSAPTADSETFSKLGKSIRDGHESKAVMKSFMEMSSDTAKGEMFLAYMAPSPDELVKDLYDESEDISYSWVREYHWNVKGEDAHDPTTYLVLFDDGEARYLPLSTKLLLRKKRAKEGKTTDETEHYPAPSSVTVRRRAIVSAMELKDPGVSSSAKGHLKRGRSAMEDDELRSPQQIVGRVHDMDQSSGAEEEMSD